VKEKEKKIMKKNLTVLSLLSFLLFLAVWVSVKNKWILPWDGTLLEQFGDWDWLGIFSIFGSSMVIGLCRIGLILFLWFRKKDFYGMVLVLAAVGGGYGLNTIIKNGVGRERPMFSHGEDGFSFPSGHAMVGSIYLLLIAYFASSEVKKRSSKWMIYILYSALALLTGISRLAKQVHYPSDVLAGFFLAFPYLYLCLTVYKFFTKKRSIKLETNQPPFTL
jgi:undecaprenyl-diphosphatase